MTEQEIDNSPKAFLVELVSNRKIPISAPECTVGRHDSNEIVISDDKSISKHHFKILFEDGKYLIEDNNSSYGTFVNGEKIDAKIAVTDGDVIKAGNSMFWFTEGERDLKVSREMIKP